MKIEKIKKMQNGKYKLELDNNEKITTYDEVILKNNLLFNKEIDGEIINQLNIDTSYYDIYYKVIKYISTKMRSRKEIDKYLEKLEVDDTDREEIINKLVSLNLIDDTKYLKAFISDKIYLSHYGPYKIKNELLEYDIDESIINSELEKYDEIFYENLTKILTKKINSNNNYSTYQFKQKMLDYFTNLGYSKDMINECLSKVDYNDNVAIEKDYKKIYNKLIRKYSGEELKYQIKNKLYQKGYSSDKINDVLKNE